MNTNTINSTRCKRRGLVRRSAVAGLVGLGTAMAGAGSTFAAPPTPSEEAGEAIGAMAAEGAGFVGDYVIPAMVIALGLGLVVGLFRRFGKKLTGLFG